MYDPDYKKQEFTKPDPMTKSIYKSKKMAYNLVRNRLDRLNPEQKKYWEGISLFIDGFESGQICDWRKFFNQPK